MPIPVVAPSAPVVLAIVPPEPAVPVPTTVKPVPLVFLRNMPFGGLPPLAVADTVVSDMLSGVRDPALTPMISTAIAFTEFTVPLVEEIVPVTLVAEMPFPLLVKMLT